MKEEPRKPSIDPQLEARIVALVLGEASDFEREELNRLIEDRSELAAFMEEIQGVHGLLKDVGAGDSMPGNDDWKLASEKRDAVLAVISGQATRDPRLSNPAAGVTRHRPMPKRWIRNIASIAALLLVAGFIASMALPSVQMARRASNAMLGMDAETATEDAFAVDAGGYMTDGVVMAIDSDEEFLELEEEAAFAESGAEHRSSRALSTLRESLGSGSELPSPYYLQDDVQYFPAGPQFKLPRSGSGAGDPRPAQPLRRLSEPASSESGGEELSRPTVDTLAVPEVGESFSADRPNDTRSLEDSPAIVSGVRDGKSDFGDDAISNMDGAEYEQFNRQRDRQSWEGQSSRFAESDSAPQEFGQQQAPGGERLPRGGTARGFYETSELDMPDIGKELDLSGDGRLGDVEYDDYSKRVDGTAPAKTPSPSSEPEPSNMAGLDVGGSFGGGGISQGLSETAAGDELWFDAERDARTGGKRDMTLEFREKGIDRYREETANDDFDLPSDESIAAAPKIEDERAKSNGRQKSKPTTRTPAAPPGGLPVTGTANGGWQYNWSVPQPAAAERDKRIAGELPELQRENADEYWEKRKLESSKQPRDFGRPVPQRGQLAANESAAPSSTFKKSIESVTRAPVAKYVAPTGLDEKHAAEEAFSTFSLHVSDVSFKLARAALASGSWPDPARIRIEEFVNALDYGDPMPTQSEKVACRMEQSVHPFLQQRNLLRVSMRTAAAGRSSSTPLRLTILVDNSGSMERIDRQQTLRRAFALLAEQLKPFDQVTLISFARQPRLLADKVSGAEANQLVQIIESLPSEGGTNIEAALQLAFEKALEHRTENAQNRVILLTDGAVNLGDADPQSLSRIITTMRGAGIAFDAGGISAEGLNDEILEALTRQGDGRYYLLDSLEAADEGFARQIAGALRPAAKNVKVQVEFNPRRVGRYKLLGFEKHRLKKEDFRDDKVDAAEMAAAEAGVAMYQFEAKPDGQGDIGSVSVRFRDLSTGQMVENRWPIPYEPDTSRLDQAAPSLRIAASAALLAAKLRGEPLGETVDLRTLSNLVAGLPDQDRNIPRVSELQQMIAQARQLSGK